MIRDSALPVKLWLWVSALATAAGWILSALGQLNKRGYLVASGLCLLLFWIFRREEFVRATRRLPLPLGRRGPARVGRSVYRRVLNRFHRPLPLAFALLSLLIFLGGILYAPSNHTALTYRIPRVLQWLAHDRWFWIHTANYRMNDRACG